MLGEGAMAEWTANYMVNVGKSTDYIAPFALFSFSGAMAVGRFLGDSARLKYGDSKLILYGGAISSIGLLIAILFPSPIIIICSLAAVGIGLSTIVPIVYSLAGNIPGVKAGVGISAVTTIGYSGFILGPPVIGFLSDLYTLRVAWCFILILFVLMSLLSFRNKAAL
jgi:fucose permease